MSSRDNQLWLQLWRDQQIDFHQKTVNNFLTSFWNDLDHSKKSRIFVPLCGKTLDMIWLADQGHEVIGVELSPIAVKKFFKENKLKVKKRRIGHFTVWRHGRISILCGDYFALKKADLGHIDTVYDRAALTALPEDIRKLYVAHMKLIIPLSTNIFLLTIEDIEEFSNPEPTHRVDEEITTLYSENYFIKLAHVKDSVKCEAESEIHTEYKLYQLSSKL